MVKLSVFVVKNERFNMFKFLGSLAVVLGLVSPVLATHCNQRIVERVVVQDYGYQNIQAVVLVPHQNVVRERVIQNYDAQPVIERVVVQNVVDYPVVEKVVVRERVRNRPVANLVQAIVETPVRVIDRVQNRQRVRVRNRVVEKQVVVENVKVERVIQRNFQRVRGY